jgi:light-regulated signal transduction histidine kinase (bacteriophytochrome)
VQQRTVELEAANKELDGFASSVAHDLNAPVRHIGAFARMLEEEARPTLNPESCECLRGLIESTERLRRLIADLLHFSRLGHTELKLETVDLNQALAAARANLQQETAARRIHWKISALPSVQGDTSLLEQVFCNLLSNALKYTSRRPLAEIAIGSRPGAEGEHVIFVHDNGVGFDMAHVHKLYGVFQRLHSTRDFEGIGMGLANVRRIIARFGGKTWAEGEEDKGATFYFTLRGL